MCVWMLCMSVIYVCVYIYIYLLYVCVGVWYGCVCVFRVRQMNLRQIHSGNCNFMENAYSLYFAIFRTHTKMVRVCVCVCVCLCVCVCVIRCVYDALCV